MQRIAARFSSNKGNGPSHAWPLLAMVLVAVLPILIFASGAAWVVVDQKKTAIEGHLKSTARALQVGMDNELRYPLDAMQVLATDVSLDTGDLTAFHEKALRVLTVNKYWRNVVLIDPKTHAIVAGGLPIPSAPVKTSSPAEVDAVASTRKEVIVGLLPAGEIVREPIIQFLVPVIRGGEVRFVLTVVMDPAPISALFTAQRLPVTWTGAVVDNRMLIAGRSRDALRYVGQNATPTLSDRIVGSYDGMFTALNQEGARVYTVFSRSPLTGWSVAIGVPAAEVDGPIQSILRSMAFAGTVLIAFALCLTALVGRRIVKGRRAYEAELKDSEAFKNVILNSVDAEIAVVNNQGVIVAVNEPWLAFEMANGGDSDKPDPSTGVGANYLSACQAASGSSDVLKIAHGIQSVMDGRASTFSAEYPCHSPSEERWFTMVVSRFGQEVDAGVVITHTEITNQIQLKLEREAALSHLQKIASRVPGMVYQFRLRPDGSSCFPFASDAIGEIYHVSPQEVREDASSTYSIVHPEDRGRVLASIQVSNRDLTPWQLEYRVKFDDGTVRWLYGNAIPEREPDGSTLWHGFLTDITVRRQSEEMLHKLSTAVEQSPASVVITDIDANIEYVNPQFTKVSGYSAEEVVGKNPRIFQSSQTSAQTYKEFWDKLTNGHSWHGQLINQRKDGTVYIEDSHVAPVSNAHGAVTHYVAVKTDVTDSVRSAERIESLLREQRAMLNNDLVGIVTVRDRNIVWANPAFEKMLGYSTGELNGTSTRQNYPTDVAFEEFGKAAYATISNGVVFRTRMEHCRKDGALIWVEISGEILNPATGESLWTYIDITQRKNAEERLIQSEAKTKGILEGAADAIFITDRVGQYQYVNSQASILLGYSIDELLKMSISDITPEEDLSDSLAQFNELLSSGSLRSELRIRRKGGIVVPVEINGALLPDGSVFGSCRDISQRKQLEESVRRLAFHDPLTSLPNRRLLRDRLTQVMAASKRSGSYAATMYLDLDNFKPLNDKHGHDAGDQLLIEVADRLTRCVREVDTVARFGGDEFVVVLSDLHCDREESLRQATTVAEKIRVALAEPYLLLVKGVDASERMVTHNCTASIGLALFLNHESSEDDILKWADAAMYEAKAAGRNVIRFKTGIGR